MKEVIRGRIILNSFSLFLFIWGGGAVICQVSEPLELLITQDGWQKPLMQYRPKSSIKIAPFS